MQAIVADGTIKDVDEPDEYDRTEIPLYGTNVIFVVTKEYKVNVGGEAIY